MRNTGKAWVVLIVILVVVLLVGLGIFRWYISGYNRAVNLEKEVETAWANIDAVLQRRFDLIPNLVKTVQGYAQYEKELFENIAKSREKYFQAGNIGGKSRPVGLAADIHKEGLHPLAFYPFPEIEQLLPLGIQRTDNEDCSRHSVSPLEAVKSEERGAPGEN